MYHVVHFTIIEWEHSTLRSDTYIPFQRHLTCKCTMIVHTFYYVVSDLAYLGT